MNKEKNNDRSLPSYGIDVNRKQSGSMMGQRNQRIELEGSDRSSLRVLARSWHERLHPKPTLHLNVLELLQFSAFTAVAGLTLYNVALYTPFLIMSVALGAFIVLGGIYFTLLAYMELPYAGLWSLLRLSFLVCAICALVI